MKFRWTFIWMCQYPSKKKSIGWSWPETHGKAKLFVCYVHTCRVGPFGKWDFYIHCCFFRNIRENWLSYIHMDYDLGCEMSFLCACLKLPVSLYLRETIRSYNSQINTLRTGDTDLRFYVTTVQDGW